MGFNTQQMVFELWSNQKYDSFVVDSRPRSVVLNLFYISYPFIKQDKVIRFTPIPQWCSFVENTNINNSYSLELFIKMYISCNTWFSKFMPLEDKINPWPRITGLGRRRIPLLLLLLHSLCPHIFNNRLG